MNNATNIEIIRNSYSEVLRTKNERTMSAQVLAISLILLPIVIGVGLWYLVSMEQIAGVAVTIATTIVTLITVVIGVVCYVHLVEYKVAKANHIYAKNELARLLFR
jgi:putative Mn2+ efflux pump MntP